MKTHVFRRAVIALMLAAALVACEKDNPTPIRPIEVPEGATFAIYPPAGTDFDWDGHDLPWNWVNLEELRSQEYRLLVIDSQEELEAHLTGSGYSAVDFSKSTLLLAYGYEVHKDYPNDTTFERISERDYVMSVNLSPSTLLADLAWRVAIVVNKLEAGSKVRLNITRDMDRPRTLSSGGGDYYWHKGPEKECE